MVSVGAKELKSRPTANVFEAMQGKAAGVDIRTSDVREKLEIYLSVVPALCLLPVSLSML